MTLSLQSLDVELDEFWLDRFELCRLAGVSEPWLRERLAHGLLTVAARGAHDEWRFDAAGLRRVRRMACLERDFDAVPELAALVADLEDELAALRAQLRRVGRA